MSECNFTIMVGGRRYEVSCSSDTAKKMFREQELADVPIIWHSRKPGWLEATNAKKAA